MVVSRKRRLPDFILAGAPRCGTTSLYHMLAAHPDVFMPEKKELWFFYTENVWEQGIDWYASQFTSAGQFSIAGEATPLYYALPAALERMSKVLPNVRLLFVFREPVKRAWSHYLFNVSKSTENLSFEEAIEADLSGTRFWRLPKGALNYVTLGMYHLHLSRVLDFFPEEQVHVLILEEVVSDPSGALSKMWDFLGVPKPESQIILSRRNSGRWLRSRRMQVFYTSVPLRSEIFGLLPVILRERLRRMRDRIARGVGPPPLSKVTLERLRGIYRPHVAELESFLGRNLTVWQEKQ